MLAEMVFRGNRGRFLHKLSIDNSAKMDYVIENKNFVQTCEKE